MRVVQPITPNNDMNVNYTQVLAMVLEAKRIEEEMQSNEWITDEDLECVVAEKVATHVGNEDNCVESSHEQLRETCMLRSGIHLDCSR